MREKLIDILANYFRIGDSYHFILERTKEAFGVGTMTFEDFREYDEDDVAEIAEYLINNDVMVRESNGCEYCKEDRDGFRTMFGAFSITNPFHGDEWFISTGRCKQRQIFYCPICGRKLNKE